MKSCLMNEKKKAYNDFCNNSGLSEGLANECKESGEGHHQTNLDD